MVICYLLPMLSFAEMDLTIQGVKSHPAVYITQENVKIARERIQNDPMANQWYESIKNQAGHWADKNPDWVKEVMPPPEACFAYGFTGCPICSGNWGWWKKAKASFDNPGHVVCPNSHSLPDDDHPDTGTGYLADDGRIHYFVGSYNSWAVETLVEDIARPNAFVYLIEKDKNAGLMATAILDELARIYPTCTKGSWDYPSNPPSGRLNRPWYQVSRILVQHVQIYDMIYDHPAMEEPSSVKGMTKRQNIEKNLILNAAAYCYEEALKQGGLHNGQADYVRGVLAAGALLGIPEYVDWATEGPYGIKNLLANNADRDGQYFETSPSYGLHTRNLYLTFSEPLYNYRGKDFPEGLNLYDDPKFQSFLLLPQSAYICLGHLAAFGDNSPTVKRNTFPFIPKNIFDFRYASHLCVRPAKEETRKSYQDLIDYFYSLSSESDKNLGGIEEWAVFNALNWEKRENISLDKKINDILDNSFFFGQKGIVVMRRGEGGNKHASLIRFGPSLIHGHLDDLNVNYFSKGYEMTYDLGYSLRSTHTQVGLAKNTISHNTLIVDEQSHGYNDPMGGSLLNFSDLFDTTFCETTSITYKPKNVEDFRRFHALTDDYALDIFSAKGGKQHDLPIHSLTTRVEFENLDFGEAREGSLAGTEYNWGDLQLNDGDMKGYPNKPYWNPPPGNGYGFLVKPRFAAPKKNWKATWMVDSDQNVKFQVLGVTDGKEELITAEAPGLYPRFPRAAHLVRRKKGDPASSCFISVWQANSREGSFPVNSIKCLNNPGALECGVPLILQINRTDRIQDFWFITDDPKTVVSADLESNRKISFKGKFGFCRLKDNELISASLVHGTRLQIGEWAISMNKAEKKGVIAKTDARQFTLKDILLTDDRYSGCPLYISNPGYSRNTVYTIDRIEGDNVFIDQVDAMLGKGIINEIIDENTLTTLIPHEYARTALGKPSGFFKGKLLSVKNSDVRATIQDFIPDSPYFTIKVSSTKNMKPGDEIWYHDVKPGDEAMFQHYASIRKIADKKYRLRTNADVSLSIPGKSQFKYTSRNKGEIIATDGKIKRQNLPEHGETVISLP